MNFENLILGSLSALEMEVEGSVGPGLSAAAGGFDQLIISGKLTLNAGSKLNIANSNAFELDLAERVVLLSFTPGSVTGQFGTAASAFANGVALNLATG